MKWNWERIVLIVLILLVVGYALVQVYGYQRNEHIADGAELAIQQLAEVTAQCQQVSIGAQGNEVTLVSLECLREANENGGQG